jgi:hypothetical protein
VIAGPGPLEARRRPTLVGHVLGEADREAGDDRRAGVPLHRGAEAGALGRATARPRRVDGRQLGADRLGQLALA